MVKYFIIVFFICVPQLKAQSNLESLLDSRRQLYSHWKEVLDQKSGIFGNQNKEDLEEIIVVLKKIITKDNEILEAIKISNSENYLLLQEKYNSLSEENDQLQFLKKSLEKRIVEEKKFQKANLNQIQRANGDKIIFGLLFLISITTILYLFRKNRVANDKLRALETIIKNANRT